MTRQRRCSLLLLGVQPLQTLRSAQTWRPWGGQLQRDMSLRVQTRQRQARLVLMRRAQLPPVALSRPMKRPAPLHPLLSLLLLLLP